MNADRPVSLEQKILRAIRRKGRGSVFINSDFYKLGTDTAVAWCLRKLKNAGIIRFLLRGVYDYPKFSKLLNEDLAPDMHRVAHALARKHRWNILPSGNTALQYWDLSTQIPLRLLYCSDGPNRSYKIGNRTLEFRHVSRKESNLLSAECEMFIQAVKELGARCMKKPYIDKWADILTPLLRKQLQAELPRLASRERELIRKIINHNQ